jgi:hypothetical protein
MRKSPGRTPPSTSWTSRVETQARRATSAGCWKATTKRGWQTIDYKRSLRIGKMLLTHDVGRAGVHAARQSLLDVGDNIVFGHTHRMQVVYQGQTTGDRHVGATLGWLGDPEAIDYRHADMVKRDWQHGFGVAHILDSGAFWLQAIPIVNGLAVVDGVVYGEGTR